MILTLDNIDWFEAIGMYALMTAMTLFASWAIWNIYKSEDEGFKLPVEDEKVQKVAFWSMILSPLFIISIPVLSVIVGVEAYKNRKKARNTPEVLGKVVNIDNVEKKKEMVS